MLQVSAKLRWSDRANGNVGFVFSSLAGKQRALIYGCITVLREFEPFAEVRSLLKMDKMGSVRRLDLNVGNLRSSARGLFPF